MDSPPEITFQEEDARTVMRDGFPLFIQHKEEIAHYQDIELAPDFAAYETAYDSGMVKAYTARENGALIAYAVYFVRPNMHYRLSLQANQDILFVTKAKRNGRVGLRLIAFADEMLRAHGVQVVAQHVKVAHNFGPLLARLGYEHVEHIWTRRLDKE